MKKWLKNFFHTLQEYKLAINSNYRGDYPDWNSALKKADGGYEQDVIIKKVTEASLKVKMGEAAYERDSILFDKIEYSWPVLAGLMWVAAKNSGHLHVLDFGGALGTHYFQNRKFLDLKELSWNIVEQEKIVEIGKAQFQDDTLKFYSSIEDCLEEQKIDVIILSGALQCLENPYCLVEKICNLSISHIILDRLSIIERERDHISLQFVHSHIYKATYPCHFFSPDGILKTFYENYREVESFDSSISNRTYVDGKYLATDRGYILEWIGG